MENLEVSCDKKRNKKKKSVTRVIELFIEFM